MREFLARFFQPRGSVTSSRVLLAFFGGLIAVGTLLLMLPFAHVGGQHVRLVDALFTSTSAVCVTGLVVYDTPTTWTPFGQAVIILLIQLGGLGVVTSVAFLRLVADRGRSIARRNVMRDAISAPQIGGINRLMSFILRVSLAIEALGAVLVMPAFVRDYGPIGMWYSVFHSISAFCNAGFDILAGHEAFSSLLAYQADPLVVLVTSALVIVGGIGFLTWDDVRRHGLRVRRYRLQTKLVLAGTAALLALPFCFFFMTEFSGEPFGRRLLLSLFCAMTPRTAGFATVDYAQMGEPGRLLTSALMMVGGSSGSTAGGVKVTTLMVVLVAAYSVVMQRRDTVAFGRRIDAEVVRKAVAFFTVYLLLLLLGTLFVSCHERIPVINALFECASALATVGLSAGVTPGLRLASKLLLVGFMFFGRIGGLTMAYAIAQPASATISKRPSERVSVG